MADPVGEFALRHTGSSYAKTPDGGLENNSNWEGTATGYGAVFGTLSVSRPLNEVGSTSGSCAWAGQAYLEDGTNIGGLGEGTWEQVEGRHKWKLSLVMEISNGDRIRSEGEIDLATRTYSGKLYAAG